MAEPNDDYIRKALDHRQRHAGSMQDRRTEEQTKQLVQNAAVNIYRAHEQALKDNESERVLNATLEKLTGDYPPKKLEVLTMVDEILPILIGSVLVVDTEDGSGAVEIGDNVDEGSDYEHPVFVRAVRNGEEVVLGYSVEAAIQLRNGLDVVINKFQKYTDD